MTHRPVCDAPSPSAPPLRNSLLNNVSSVCLTHGEQIRSYAELCERSWGCYLLQSSIAARRSVSAPDLACHGTSTATGAWAWCSPTPGVASVRDVSYNRGPSGMPKQPSTFPTHPPATGRVMLLRSNTWPVEATRLRGICTTSSCVRRSTALNRATYACTRKARSPRARACARARKARYNGSRRGGDQPGLRR